MFWEAYPFSFAVTVVFAVITPAFSEVINQTTEKICKRPLVAYIGYLLEPDCYVHCTILMKKEKKKKKKKEEEKSE